MRHDVRPVALALAVALTLAGCGTSASVVTVPKAQTAPVAAAAPVAAVQPTVVRVESASEATDVGTPAKLELEEGIKLIGTEELSDAELKADAEDATYKLTADAESVSVPHVTGYVRRSDGNHYLLEANKDQYGNTRPVTYSLYCPDMPTYTWMGEHVDKRVNIKGIFQSNGIVTVTFADSAIDLSFLTNWWTKGKLKGTANSVSGLPLVNCEVKVRSAEGYVYYSHSDNNGNFSVKNLEPGWYQVWFSKPNYRTVSSMVDIYKHKSTNIQGVLWGP